MKMLNNFGCNSRCDFDTKLNVEFVKPFFVPFKFVKAHIISDDSACWYRRRRRRRYVCDGGGGGDRNTCTTIDHWRMEMNH